jgi:Ca2+-binding EF-hand superfamily protein
MSTVSAQSILKAKQELKAKLKYEWKGIYRHLSNLEKGGRGLVTLQEFTQALTKFGAYLSRDDLNRISRLYSADAKSGLINFNQLSLDLGLHLHSFQFLKPNLSR